MKDRTTFPWFSSPSWLSIWTPADGAGLSSYTRPTRATRRRMEKTLAAAKLNLEAVHASPTAEDPAECVTDKGYHSRSVLTVLDFGPWKTSDLRAQAERFRALATATVRPAGHVTNNRTRLLSGVAKEAFNLRAEIVERSFAGVLERVCMRRTWLRGRENVHKRYPLHVARPQSESPDAQTDRRRHPAGGPCGRIWLYLRAYCASWSRSGRTSCASIVSEDGETANEALCFTSRLIPRSIAPFSAGLLRLEGEIPEIRRIRRVSSAGLRQFHPIATILL